MSFENDGKVTIHVTVDSSMDEVWNNWTSPEHIVHWNFASDDWCCPAAENDVRVGGQFSWRMEAKDGSFGFDFCGEYTEVVKNKLLEYRLGDGRPVCVEFTQVENGVELKETFQGEDENTLEMQEKGWQNILNNFKKHVEK